MEGHAMKITVSGTNKELAEFFKLSALDEKFKLLVKENALAKEENLDDRRLEELFGRISWDTFYLWHLICVEGPKRHSETYLTVKDLDKFSIKERSASAMVAGTKKVTRSLGMEEVISIKWRNNEKRYYVPDEAKSYILQLVEVHKDEYEEWFQEWRQEWPIEEKRWIQELIDEGVIHLSDLKGKNRK
jgi:hypothetical protein